MICICPKSNYKGRKPSLDNEKLKEIKKRIKQGDKKSIIAREYNVSRETLYKYLSEQTFTKPNDS
jgi:DNA invertase Pin-like site-specific DNA recombinase